MKKFTLVALAMMASASCFAQKQILWNGEDKSDGLWPRCTPEIVDNPSRGGINTSEKCVKFTITGNDWEHGDIVLDLKNLYGEGGLDMTKSKRLSIMVKKSLSSNVKIELSAGENTYTKRIASWYDGNGQWQKLVFDFTNNSEFGDKGNPTELAIYPGIEGGQEGSQEIYVDNIVLEDNPTVNGNSLWSAADGSLTGKLELTGGYFKTECSNVDNGWEKIYIDDFAKLNDKLSADVTSIDMRKASTLGVDINKFFENKNPNTIVYANENYKHANVVVGDNGTGTADNLELTDAYAFNAPENFTATNVKLTRSLQNDINSFVLPFHVSAEDLGCKVATYKNCNAEYANFKTAESVDANTPFLTIDANKDLDLTFRNKGIVETPKESLGTNFVGVYTRTKAEGFYGINGEGKLQKGGAEAYVNPFHAYLNVDKQLDAVAFDGSTVTAINGIAADKVADTAVYDLSGRRVNGKLNKGLYIMNGKKVVVK